MNMHGSIWRQFLLSVLAISFLLACNKDETDTASIVGKWAVSEYTTGIKVNGVDILAYFTQTFGISEELAKVFIEEYEPEGSKGTIDFKMDGRYISVFDGDEDDGTWLLSEDNKKLIMDANTEFETIMDVQTLNSNTLIVSFTVIDNEEDVDDDGKYEIMEMLIQITFNR